MVRREGGELPSRTVMTYQVSPVLTDDQRVAYFNRFVREKFGDYAYLERKSLTKEREGKWGMLGGVSRPYYILDSENSFPHLRYDIIPEAFSIELSAEEDGIELRSISKRELRTIVESRIRSKTSKYESIILTIVKDNLSRINQIQSSHAPIIRIIQNLPELFEGKIDLENREFRKWQRYLPLFSNLEIVRDIGEMNFTMGDAYKGFEKKIYSSKRNLTDQDFVKLLFGYVIQYGSNYLNQYLNLTSSKPYISLANTFYLYASKIGHNFKTSIENFFNYYKESYGKTRFYTQFKSWVFQLDDVGILHTEDKNFVSGNKHIFERFNAELKSFQT